MRRPPGDLHGSVVPARPSIFEPETPRPPPRPPPGSLHTGWDLRSRFFAFLALFFLMLVAASLAIDNVWWTRPYEVAYYFFPCGLAVFFVGLVQTRLPPTLRLLVPGLVAVGVFAALLVGDPFRVPVGEYFLYFLPVFGAIALLGTGRWRWDLPRFFGATLILVTIWRPLFSNFPSLTAITRGTGGVLQPYTLIQLYRIVNIKLVYEVLFLIIGLLLLFNRFPFVQKRPDLPDDARAVLAGIDAGYRRGFWWDLGLGTTTLAIALLGTYLINFLAAALGLFQGGADETRLFENMTPLLVLLLSLVAGFGEELLFRAILQPRLERGYLNIVPGQPFLAVVLAVITQALLFGVVHAGYLNPLHVLLPFAFGVLTGFAFKYWGFLAVVYAHVGIDLIAFGSYAATYYFPQMGFFVVAFALGNVFLGLIILIYLILDSVARRGERRARLPAE